MLFAVNKLKNTRVFDCIKSFKELNPQNCLITVLYIDPIEY